MINFDTRGGSGPGWSAEQLNGVGITGVFGGFKQSGVGREWDYRGIEAFTELKCHRLELARYAGTHPGIVTECARLCQAILDLAC